jgi:hypothetical protein
VQAPLSLRRIRRLGLFQGIEQDLPDQLELEEELPELFERDQLPPPDDPTFDPLSDPLDEPFPEEY